MDNSCLHGLKENIEKVLIGKGEEVKLVLVGLLAQGHILIEDVPGVGKTVLARALAKSIACTFQRIQFTPDLLPSDILGVSLPNPKKGDFEFKPGPIFANIILADEVNRATPRTQSSLLEAMNDFQVTIDGFTHPLPKPFMVLATQNPIEYQGTYPLPESQLDRFMLKLQIGYPEPADEKLILAAQKITHPLENLQPVITADKILSLQEQAKKVRVDDAIIEYLLQMVNHTRHSDKLMLGISPRGSIYLFRAAQALAFIEDRHYCIPDDIKRLVKPVFSHRLIPREQPRSGISKITDTILEGIMEQAPVPL
ncbi:MAG: hypothetical protein A3G93_05845 [Nitrospinae bacterium RIFCSPLOWO2_12_FULL_45_22]|nr:MAG: hypothetical protein A3G93_05845 [Nitrospinae bacterium RIFCSPLOWO2_12_FULL_45_22]